jgi:penicillin amidase
MPDSMRAGIPNLEGVVRVMYDDRRVPHIFAETRTDAIRALGYVVARDRLFQLDLQARATAGTLSELLGEAALPADQQSRRLGLAWAAEQNFRDIEPASDVAALLEAYSDGVNAWINNLNAAAYPIEYRLLESQPAAWMPQYSLYLLKRMGWTLSYINVEHTKERAAALVGREAADALFPIHSPIQDPIQTTGATGPRFDSLTFPPPGLPDASAAQRTRVLDFAMGSSTGTSEQCTKTLTHFDCDEEDALGSNSWAIGPLKSVTGNAVLAGDPHLELTLPSIWYEAHLVVPGELDVYGVTIPGSPGIVIGFNRDVAWTFTNTGADVLDFYDEMFDNADTPTRYMLDGAWRTLETRIEEYRDERDRVIGVDTVYHTHRGPVIRNEGRNLSIRWTVLEDQGEQRAFNQIVTATTVDDWLAAMEGFVSPAQNGLVADRYGSIAIRSHGRFPIRPGNQRGYAILDGTTSTTDWIGYWPVARYPFSIDPARAFLSSANQQPIDPRADAGYLGVDWPAPWRAMHINSVLGQDSTFTADDMRKLQTHAGSARADFFVPYFLNAAERTLAGEERDTTLGQALRLLGDWNRLYNVDNDRAILFELAMSELTNQAWDELHNGERRVATPGSDILATLMSDSTNVWWDNRTTPHVETRDTILNSSLRDAFVEARARFGLEDEGGWTWSGIRDANIFHLLRLPGFSELDIPVQGGPATLSPLSGAGTDGASWRMIVELGDTVGAWVTYPGGQSGNPVSAFYADRISEWARGDLSVPLVPESRERMPANRVVSRLTLTGTP